MEGAETLREEEFRAEEVVGLTAGTSALPETVEAVRVRLGEFYGGGCASNIETRNA